MEKWERHDLKWDIITSKWTNLLSMLCFSKDWLRTMYKSMRTFGTKSVAVKEMISIFEEMKKTIKAENDLYYYLYKHSKEANYEAVQQYLADLFELDIQTFDFYADYLEEIQVACDLDKEYRIVRDEKAFKTLIESNEFFAKLLEITIDEDELLRFLNISQEFLRYVNAEELRTVYVNYNDEHEREFIGVNYKLDEKGCLKDIKIFIPEVINLETALLYIHTAYIASRLYSKLTQRITDEEVKDILNEASKQRQLYEQKYRQKEKELLPYK